MKRYRLQRRAIGRVYSMANVLNHEAAIDAAIKLATQKLASLKGEELDLREWMHIIAVECLGASVLSWSPGLLRDGQDGGTLMHSFKGWRRRSLFGVFPGMKKLEQWSPGLGRMFASLWGVVHKPPGDFRPFFPVSLTAMRCAVQRLTQRLQQGHREDCGPKDESFPGAYNAKGSST